MTNRDIYKMFCNEYQNISVADYRPLAGNVFTENRQGITLFMENGDILLYFPATEKRSDAMDVMRENMWRKFNDGWFTYYVNVVTGRKKFKLEPGDFEVD